MRKVESHEGAGVCSVELSYDASDAGLVRCWTGLVGEEPSFAYWDRMEMLRVRLGYEILRV